MVFENGVSAIKKSLQVFLTMLVVGYVSAVASLYVMQRPMFYGPDKNYRAPATLGISDAEEVTIVTPDKERLQGWYRAANAGQPTVLFLHGKGGNISFRANRWKNYSERAYGILFFDYRGFGASTGEATEAGLKTDALAAYDWLAAKGVLGENIILAGESMGTGLAVILATERPVAGISLMSGYSSIVDVAAQRYWWVPTRLLLTERFEILPHAVRLKVPMLAQHGELDQTIPLKFGQRLFAAIASQKQFELRKGKGHNDFGAEESAIEQKFFESLK
jgi:uncharacterized protein